MRFCTSGRPHITVHPPRNPTYLDSGAYLDDWCIWIKPQYIAAAIDLAANATRTINIELQPTKIQIWTASCTSPIPPLSWTKPSQH